MTGRSDVELLGEYARDGSEAAFTELVVRHRNWVRSMAMRRTHDEQLADDVTQGVFIVLARKARAMKKGTVLSPWLFGVTRFVASRAMRGETRRRRHETAAAEMAGRSRQVDDSSGPDDQIARELDQAVAGLGAKDRSAVLLRFYERKSLADVGAALDISEEAAGKRVSRAIDKLRSKLSRKGAAASAPALAAWLEQHAVHTAIAPVHALASAAISAACGKSTAGSALIFAKGALRMMFWNHIKWTAAICLLVSLPVAVPCGIWMRSVIAADRQPAPTPAQSIIMPKSGPAAALAKTEPAPGDAQETHFVLLNVLWVDHPQASADFYCKLGFIPDGSDTPADPQAPRRVKGGMARFVFNPGQTTPNDRAARGKFHFILVMPRGEQELAAFRDTVIANGIEASEITHEDNRSLFAVTDPDGYILAFESTNPQ